MPVDLRPILKKRLGFEQSSKIIGPHQVRIANDSESSIELAEEILKDDGKFLIESAYEGMTLILYDRFRFHQENSKKRNSILRRLDLEKRLKQVDSQHAKQLI